MSLLLPTLLLIAGPQSYRMTTLRSDAIKGIEVAARFPVFQGASPLNKLANRTLSAQYREQINQFLKEVKELEVRDNSHVYFSIEAKPVANNLKVISVQATMRQYLGGAHDAMVYMPINFGITPTGPKQLKLKDLFKPGTDLKAEISDPIIAALMKDERATWVQNKEKKALDPEDYESFVVTKNSIRFLFSPYNMGPWAAGPIEFDFPLSKLSKVLKRN